jgi:hypothetical protein
LGRFVILELSGAALSSGQLCICILADLQLCLRLLCGDEQFSKNGSAQTLSDKLQAPLRCRHYASAVTAQDQLMQTDGFILVNFFWGVPPRCDFKHAVSHSLKGYLPLHHSSSESKRQQQESCPVCVVHWWLRCSHLYLLIRCSCSHNYERPELSLKVCACTVSLQEMLKW